MELMELVNTSAQFIGDKLQGRKPQIGIVLGSGLGKLADSIENKIVIPYKTIPGFVQSTAIGHAGNLICGTLGGKTVLAMQGRFHYYEGHSMQQVVHPIRTMIKLGIRFLFVSNAAGAINRTFAVGDIMIIDNHINLLPSPLIGPNVDEFGVRFPDMSRPYDTDVIRMADNIGKELGYANIKHGVYLSNSGPNYETAAEINYYRTIGADAVGMSTTPEVIAARHARIPVFGCSVITNATSDADNPVELDGDEVVEIGNRASEKMGKLFTTIIERIEL